MELRWILLCVSVVIIALVAWHTSRSSFTNIISHAKRLLKREDQLELFTDEETQVEECNTTEGIVCLHIKAKQGDTFGGEQLLIQLNQAGLRYGEMNIFHYNPDNTNAPLFSLASAFEPGCFDIDRMDHFNTEGLALFMEAEKQANPSDALDSLLDIAEDLTEKLDGELLDHKWRILTEDQVDTYYSHLT